MVRSPYPQVDGTLTFEETHARSNAIARALRDEGLTSEDGVAIMCRTHPGFVEATMACSVCSTRVRCEASI